MLENDNHAFDRFDTYGKATFVTGGGLPNRHRRISSSDESEDVDDTEQLEREVDQHKQDMKDMFN